MREARSLRLLSSPNLQYIPAEQSNQQRVRDKQDCPRRSDASAQIAKQNPGRRLDDVDRPAAQEKWFQGQSANGQKVVLH